MGRQGNRNSFKQILLGMHNYYDVYKSLPPGDKVRDAEGHSKLSWRVYILPFVENVQLYREFHLDEAWDSPHNMTLLEKMPDIYGARTFGDLSRGDIKPGYTTFLAPMGEDTAFGGTKATLFSHITDGTSNTVVLVEVKPELAVPWTAPDDYVFDPATPGSGLQIGPDGKFLAALADGSVLELRGDLKPEQFLRLFKMSDGEVVDLREMR